jgi:hypothetical protein
MVRSGSSRKHLDSPKSAILRGASGAGVAKSKFSSFRSLRGERKKSSDEHTRRRAAGGRPRFPGVAYIGICGAAIHTLLGATSGHLELGIPYPPRSVAYHSFLQKGEVTSVLPGFIACTRINPGLR